MPIAVLGSKVTVTQPTPGPRVRMVPSSAAMPIENSTRFCSSLLELRALNTAIFTVAWLGGMWRWTPGNYAAQITATDPRYVPSDANPTGSTGAWILVDGVPTGGYSRAEGARFIRLADRLMLGAAASYGGEWTVPSGMTGLNATARDLHSWAFRDGGLIYDDIAGSMAIVGHSQSSREGEWPGSPTFNPAAIGISGFAVNDAAAGFNGAWGGYFDAVRMNSGFTVAQEVTMANASTEGATPTPYNLKSGGSQSGVSSWLAVGCGLDIAWPEYELVNHSSAYQAMLTSYRDDGGTVAWENGRAYVVGRAANDGATAYVCLVGHTAPSTGTFSAYRTANPSHWAARKSGAWAFSTAYNVGDLAVDAASGNTFRCRVAHTSPGSGLFSTYRAANTTHWKQNPSAYTGTVVARGAIAENSPGSDLYPIAMMPDRHQYQWWRDNAGTPELSAFLWATRSPNGTPARGITFDQHGFTVAGSVAFPNVNSTEATRLDWYEEGTATLGMTIGGSATGITFSANTATYTRVGNVVTARCRIVLTSKGTNTGAVVITGIPFGSVGDNLANAISTGFYSGFAAGITAPPHGFVSVQTVVLYKSGAGTSTAMADTDLTNSSRIEFSVTYRVA
jgi:hypothetical protein